MTTSTTECPRTITSPVIATARPSPVYSILIGIAGLAVLLQGLWAGLFLEHDGQRNAASNWIEVHAKGGEVAQVFAALAAAYAIWKRRSRKDLWVGGLVFTLLLVAEAYIGGLIVDEGQDVLTVVHVPVAMALMGLAVWLPLRASRGR